MEKGENKVSYTTLFLIYLGVLFTGLSVIIFMNFVEYGACRHEEMKRPTGRPLENGYPIKPNDLLLRRPKRPDNFAVVKVRNAFIETRESVIGYIQFRPDSLELWVWLTNPESTGTHHQIRAIIFKTNISTKFIGISKLSIPFYPNKGTRVMRVSVQRNKEGLCCTVVEIRPATTSNKTYKKR